MLLIKNGNILTMSKKIVEDGYIFIEKEKIKEIGIDVNKFSKSKLKKCKVIDAKGKYVLPGLIDPHCHIGMWEDGVGFEGDDGNEDSEPITPQLRALDSVYHFDRAFEEARESGITTVVTGPGSANVIGGQFIALKTFGRSVDDMVLKKYVAQKVAFGENPKTVHNEKKQMPTTRMATAALLRETLYKAKEYLEMLEEYEKDKEENDKPDFDLKMEALIPVLKQEIPLKIHAHRSDDILTGIRIAKEFNLKYSLEHCTEGYIITDILKNEKADVVVGPLISDRSKIELRNQSIKNPGLLAKEGITVAIMTDHPVVPIQYLSLSAAIAVREGMNEEDALKAITINAAKVNGIEERVGSIEINKDADIIIMNGHPFDLKTKVDYTIINGEIVFERNYNDKY